MGADTMSTNKNPNGRTSSSRELLRAISEAQEVYDRRYRELISHDEGVRDIDDSAATWLAVLRGPTKASGERR